MKKTWLKIVMGILIVVLMAVLVQSCAKKQQPSTQPTTSPNQPTPSKPVAPPRTSKEPNAAPAPAVQNAPVAPSVPTDPNVVAVIGECVIIGEDFKTEYLRQLQPNPYSGNPVRPAPELKTVLMRMLGDKAMILEARQQGMDKKEEIQAVVKRMRQQRLATKVVMAAIEPQISVSEQDVNAVMTANPKLTKDQASAEVRNRKGRQAFDRYYSQLVQNRHVQKVSENLSKAAAIHQRLQAKPKAGNVFWIINEEVRNDITPDEKALALATFDGGTFTVKDWFEALCEVAPPSRPKDLGTPEVAERFLDRVLIGPLLAAEAIAKGFDKDEGLNKALRKTEDDMVFGYAQMEKVKGLSEPNDLDIAAFFEPVKDTYARPDSLKLDMIWCRNRDAAAKAKADLDQGKDVNAVGQEYSIDKKAFGPLDAYAGSEGLFWLDLWKAEPNQVVGPILGFHGEGLSWRVVKVLDKRPGKPAELANVKGMIKDDLFEQRQQTLLDKVRETLLHKFPHQVFADRLVAFDPRNVP